MLKHAATATAVQSFCKYPAHALLLLGPSGSGKRTIGLEITQILLETVDLHNYPYFLEVTYDDLSISAVREIKLFLSKTTTGRNSIRRVVLINSIDKMDHSGQNALLKSIEEPPTDTVIIMTASDSTLVLPTILSRAQQLQVLPIEMQNALAYYGKELSKEDIIKAFTISKGFAALLEQHLQDKNELPELELARQLLQADTFRRLSMVDEIIKSKVPVDKVLTGIEIAIRANFEKSLDSQKRPTATKLHAARQELQHAQQMLAARVNTKLVLTRLFLNI